MKSFKNKKIIYILCLSVITLLAIIISPTYAKFIDSYVSDDTVAQMDLSFDVGITGIDEYHEVVVNANDTLKFNVQIDNNSDVIAYYGVWYKMVVPGELPDDDSIKIGRLNGTEVSTSGEIESNGSKTVTVGIINDSSNKIKLYVGVASSATSTGDIEYLNGKRLITGDIDLYKLNAFVERVMFSNSILDEGMDFSKTSNNSIDGVYLRSETEFDEYPIYYYRGQVNNNLIFANICWKVVRTTDTGGLKLLYNGIPVNGQCNNTGAASMIGIKEFSSSVDSPAYVGYMYSDVYAVSSKYLSNETDVYYYANDVTYSDGMYTLVETDIKSGIWSEIYNELGNYHYTCFGTDKACESVYYMTYIDQNKASYITLDGGNKVGDALVDMFGTDGDNLDNYNTVASVIKGDDTIEGTLDNWYYINIEQAGYSSYVEDTVWCNDRTISLLETWDSNSGSLIGDLYFSAYKRLFTTYTPTLMCSRNIDSFTISKENGNGNLKYPVGLLTMDEVMLAGGSGEVNKSYYLYNGSSYWTATPSYFSSSSLSAFKFFVSEDGYLAESSDKVLGLRPMISLKFGFGLKEVGDGTAANPYIVS